MLTVTNRDNGRRVSAHLGQTLELHLAENATTGYRWAVDTYDSSLLQLTDTSAEYPDTAPGSGGQVIFHFKVVGAGLAKLSLKHWRQWEGPASVIESFSVTVDAIP